MVKKIAKGFGITVLCLGLIAVGGVLWPPAQAPLPPTERHYVITKVHVIDIASGTVGPLQSVTIANGRITEIGAEARSPLAHEIDGQDGFLIPGLWDMHSHSLQLSPQLHFPLQVANGVTSVRDMMGCPEKTDSLIACEGDKRRWTKAAENGRLVSPRFVSVASFYFDDPAMTPKKAESKARLYAGRGVDYLKIYDRISRPAYFRLAKVSRELGVPMIGHLPKAVSLGEAIAAGQSSFEHARLFLQEGFAHADDWRRGKLDDVPPTDLAIAMVTERDVATCDRLFALMAAKTVWFVPTHVTREEDARADDPAYLRDERLAYADPLSLWAWKDDASATRARYPGQRGRDALRSHFEKGLKLTRRAHDAGVPILVGTDTIIGGFRMHDEMRLLVRAGLSPAEVLRAATLEAARYAGKEEKFGTIEEGKQADMVLLSANPLDDIANTRAISDVFIAGHHYDRGLLDRLLAFTKEQAHHPANWIKMLWGFARSSVRSSL
ncbi:amidohydrolase family protein [soil metagenome]